MQIAQERVRRDTGEQAEMDTNQTFVFCNIELVGDGLQEANLWMGDGGMVSALHLDGMDNMLMQLQGLTPALTLMLALARALSLGLS